MIIMLQGLYLGWLSPETPASTINAISYEELLRRFLHKVNELVKEVNSRLNNKKDKVVEDKPAKTSYTHRQFIKDVQAATGAKVDGIAGSETLSKTVTVSAKTNRKHKVVLPLQKELYRLGYTEVGKADGIAGSKFKEAVMHYQNDNFGKADGIITAKKNTWKSLLGMEV